MKKPKIIPTLLGRNPFLLHLRTNQNAHIQLFRSPEHRKSLTALTPRASELLLWLMQEVPQGKDHFWLNAQNYMQEKGISSYNTYNSAVNCLVKARYIARVHTPTNVFWINLHFFYNGDRTIIKQNTL